jgi:hypothetical protein
MTQKEILERLTLDEAESLTDEFVSLDSFPVSPSQR